MSWSIACSPKFYGQNRVEFNKTEKSLALSGTGNSCRCGEGLAGGYQHQDTSNEDLVTYAALAMMEHVEETSNATLQACNPDLREAARSIQIDGACRQVVSGTNYLIVFNVNFPCRSEPKTQINAELVAIIYQPLPQTNEPPSVTSVRQIG